MNEIIDKEIFTLVFENFINKAHYKLKEIDQKIKDEHKKKDFKILDILNLDYKNIYKKKTDKYKENTDEQKEKLEKFMKNIDIDTEDILNEKVDEVVKKLKNYNSYIDIPKEYEEIKNKLENEVKYNNITLKNNINKDLSNIISNIIEVTLSCCDDYNKGYLENIEDLRKILEEEKCFSSLVSVVIGFIEDVIGNENEDLKKSIKAIKNKQNIALTDIQYLLKEYINYRVNEKKEIYNVKSFSLNLDVTLEENKLSNLNKIYLSKHSNGSYKEYEKLISKYLKEVK